MWLDLLEDAIYGALLVAGLLGAAALIVLLIGAAFGLVGW